MIVGTCGQCGSPVVRAKSRGVIRVSCACGETVIPTAFFIAAAGGGAASVGTPADVVPLRPPDSPGPHAA